VSVCSGKLSDIQGISCNIFRITKPNANIKEITNSINLKDENLTKKDVVIICGGTRDVAKNEVNDGLRILSEFAKLTLNTNVIVMCVPHHFDLQPSSCINKEVKSFNRKSQKMMKTFSHMHVCNMSINRDHFTSHGLHLNSQGKNSIINKWVSIITSIISKSRIISVNPLPWMEKSDNNNDDDREHRNELVTEGKNMPKKKYSLSQEEIFFSAPELGVGSQYREEVAQKEIPGLPISETSEQCKRDKEVKHIVPIYSLSDEEGKEEVIYVMSSSGKIRKSNRIKSPPSTKLDDFLWSI